MTSEPPRAARRNRPDDAFRRRALAAAAANPSGPPAVRESLRESLARIPDRQSPSVPATPPSAHMASADGLAAFGPGSAPGGRPIARGARPARAAVLAAAASSTVTTAAPAPPSASTPRPPIPPPDDAVPPGSPDDAVGEPPEAGGAHETSSAAPLPAWRRVAFAVVLLSLVAAIPALAGAGYRLVTDSTDGRLGKSGAAPTDPGYEELVNSTPTAVVVQTNAKGYLVGLTFLSLGAESGGGSVVFVPLETEVPSPGFGIDRLRLAHDIVRADPQGAARQAAGQVGQILNVGIDEVIQLDDAGWANIVKPVAPFPIDNLDTLDLKGFPLAAGTVPLPGDLMGPYLGVKLDREGELSRNARQEQVWRGWLDAVGSSALQDAVPGESGSGMGLFARTLAAGPVSYSTLPVDPVAGPLETYAPDEAKVAALVVDAVPAPDAALPGSRKTLRLLNGVAAGPIPSDLLRTVVAQDGSVTVVGNGPSFGRGKTTIVYADPLLKSYAEGLKKALGATGSVKLDRTAPDNLDVTVVFGRDVLGDVPVVTTSVAGDAAPSTSSTVAPPGGN